MPLTQVSPGLLDSNAQYYGFKNRIINGAMVIDQRNNGASVTPVDGGFMLDRWKNSATQASRISYQRVSTAPAEFVNSMLVTSLGATTVGTNDTFGFYQPIEGFNIADFGFGTSNAKSITVSFWVRSSITGTYSVSVTNGAVNRCYPVTYTINSANTFEFKTITILGDTSGTWTTDNTAGLQLFWNLGAGSLYGGATSGAWVGALKVAATGQTNWVSTNGATFYITGVQLEKGSTATSFDYRPYGTELALCQRYCIPYGLGDSNVRIAYGSWGSSTQAFVTFPFPVEMRVTPGFTLITSGALLLEGVAWYAVTGTPILSSESSNKLGIAIVNVASSAASAGQVAIWGNGSISQAKCIFAAEL